MLFSLTHATRHQPPSWLRPLSSLQLSASVLSAVPPVLPTVPTTTVTSASPSPAVLAPVTPAPISVTYFRCHLSSSLLSVTSTSNNSNNSNSNYIKGERGAPTHVLTSTTPSIHPISFVTRGENSRAFSSPLFFVWP
ncbi:hypothetical protein F5148DRAFT_1164886 [Russula earlei]|uniref:Uncharacterized protein n=1 Tax=Russula earlei TaxID=71964 RepID=A0ACC0UKM9_9AGAM|nr:hypothetical protein F5148DRAFT_1164886 [Russula earlei]